MALLLPPLALLPPSSVVDALSIYIIVCLDRCTLVLDCRRTLLMGAAAGKVSCMNYEGVGIAGVERKGDNWTKRGPIP